MTSLMPSPEQKQEARLMFLSGRGATEIAKTLGLTLRTVQRWFAEWRGVEKPKKEVNPATSIVKVDPEVIKQIQSTTTEPKLLGFDGTYQEWDATITNKFKEAGKVHYNERLICQSERDKKIAEGTFTSRDANSFSQAIGRHLDGEIRMLLMGKSDLPTMSQSYAGMKTAGFTIVKTRIEDDTLSQSDITSEIAGESGEGHGTTES